MAALKSHHRALLASEQCTPASGLARTQLALYRTHSSDFASPAGGTDYMLDLLSRLRLQPMIFVELGANKGLKMLRILETWDEQWKRVLHKLHPSLCASMGPHWSVHSKCSPGRPGFQYHGIEMRPSNFELLSSLRSELAIGHSTKLYLAGMADYVGTLRVCEDASSTGIGDEMMDLSTAETRGADKSARQGARKCSLVNVTTIDRFVREHVPRKIA